MKMTLSIEESRTRLDVSRRTIYNMLRDGRLQARPQGSSKRVTIESIRDVEIRRSLEGKRNGV